MKMKRQIKFRVWLDHCDAFEYPNALTLHKDGSVETDKSKGGILQQYTGLKDKNGKEVYEGDIVYDRVTADYNDKRMDYFEVSYNEEYSAFVLLQLKPDEDGQHWKSWNWIRNIKSYGEVVGNIFENPKLIKKPKKNKVVKKD